MRRSPTTNKPIRPSAAARDAYQRSLEREIDSMGRSLARWLKAAYRPQAFVLTALDASPADVLQRAMNKLAKRWLRNFDKLSDTLATRFAGQTRGRIDRETRAAGFTVRFKPTKAMNDAYDAVRNENVSLIRSIAAQHLTAVEQLVQRSVSTGRDLGSLAQGLEKQLGVTKRRAAFIARDQNNKATAVLQRARHLEMGITRGKWLHSAGGHTPRPPHVAFSGQTFDLTTGHDFEDGEGFVWPGTAINCRCVYAPVIPGFDDD